MVIFVILFEWKAFSFSFGWMRSRHFDHSFLQKKDLATWNFTLFSIYKVNFSSFNSWTHKHSKIVWKVNRSKWDK